jgi:molybdopterin synthase sulfur carrier subunit
MRITFKLYASLTRHLPPEARQGNQMTLEVADGTPISRIVEPFGMPEKLVHLVLVNGVYVPPAERLSFVPKDGDVLAIWPPIAGG